MDSFLSLDQLAVGVLSRDDHGGLVGDLTVTLGIGIPLAAGAGPVLDVAGLGAGSAVGGNMGQGAGVIQLGSQLQTADGTKLSLLLGGGGDVGGMHGSLGGQILQSGLDLVGVKVGVAHVAEVVGSHSALQLGLSVDSFLSLDQLAVGVLSRDLDLNDGGLALAVAEVVAAVNAGPVLDVAGLGAGGVLGLNMGQAAGMAAVGVLVLRFGISLALGIGQHRGVRFHEDGSGGVKADDPGIGLMIVLNSNNRQTFAADHGAAADVGVLALDADSHGRCTLGIGTDGTAGHGEAADAVTVVIQGAVHKDGGTVGGRGGCAVDVAVDAAALDGHDAVINEHHAAAQGSGVAGNGTALDGDGSSIDLVGSGAKDTAVSSRVAGDDAVVHGELGGRIQADGGTAVRSACAVAADLTAVHNEFGGSGLIGHALKADSNTALAVSVQGVVDDLAVVQSQLAGHMDQGIAGSNTFNAGNGAVFAAVLNGELSAVGHVDVGECSAGQGIAVQVEDQSVAYGQRVRQTHVIGQGDGAVLGGGKQVLGRHHSRGGHKGGGDHVLVGVGHHNEGLSLLDVGSVHSQGVQSITRLGSNRDGDGGAGNARGGIDGHSTALADGSDGGGVGVTDGPGIVSIGVVLAGDLAGDNIVGRRLTCKTAALNGVVLSAGGIKGEALNIAAGDFEVIVVLTGHGLSNDSNIIKAARLISVDFDISGDGQGCTSVRGYTDGAVLLDDTAAEHAGGVGVLEIDGTVAGFSGRIVGNRTAGHVNSTAVHGKDCAAALTVVVGDKRVVTDVDSGIGDVDAAAAVGRGGTCGCRRVANNLGVAGEGNGALGGGCAARKDTAAAVDSGVIGNDTIFNGDFAALCAVDASAVVGSGTVAGNGDGVEVKGAAAGQADAGAAEASDSAGLHNDRALGGGSTYGGGGAGLNGTGHGNGAGVGGVMVADSQLCGGDGGDGDRLTAVLVECIDIAVEQTHGGAADTMGHGVAVQADIDLTHNIDVGQDLEVILFYIVVAGRQIVDTGGSASSGG